MKQELACIDRRRKKLRRREREGRLVFNAKVLNGELEYVLLYLLVRLPRYFDPLLEFSHSTSGGPENDARGAKAGKRGGGQLLMIHRDIDSEAGKITLYGA